MSVRPIPGTLLSLLLLCSAGCGSDAADGLVVVGLTTELAVGFDIERVERTTKVDGVVTRTEGLSYRRGQLSLPAELEVGPARDGAEVELSIAAFRDGEASPVLTRKAATRAAGGRSVLLPVSLDEACCAISCAASATCAAGACVDPFIAPSALDDYDPQWIASANDACKTPSSGDPAVVIGLGQDAFASLEHGEVVPIEAGPQGGHHVWLALRVTGLRQMGSRLTVEGYFPELEFELLPFTAQITLHRAAEGGCEIDGVRFQVDRGLPVETVRGQALDIQVTLEDPNGDVGTAAQRVVLSP
ncbi:hypothetical protein predicted by Glimmer/Critica [Sorangium cellulosum So ce56]|uniref:Secreted protein n=1 Tax=Sorangium cellulosum (strain So ce56) TaxID=448385 RepID=A9GUL2_SORC5|nr:hypothetical protein [Sorangium cellulosum]CAN90637.1 hypothetical protein predicted by Glimmer/Critica [Sorangium cellulosum So ce56]